MTSFSSPKAAHILSLVQTLRGGGVERTLLRLAGDWVEAGRQVTLLMGMREGPLVAELPDGVRIVELGTSSFPALRALPAIARDVQPDLIFCPGNHYTSIAGFTRLQLGQAAPPIVAKISNALARPDHRFPLAQAYRWWLRRHPRFIDHFVAMSPAMRDEAICAMRADPARLSIIANPAPRLPSGTSPANIPARPLLVGVGRLELQKRWDRLIDAIARIDDASTRLIIVGEGSARPALEAQIARLGLGQRVTLIGYRSNPAPYLAAASAVVLTSDFEGVPGVLREALALGTPVVATESSVAVREIIADPTRGTIVPIGDQMALVAALNHWLGPDVTRPMPVAPAGEDAANAYLALFDRLVRERRDPVLTRDRR
ncbi:MULTISPECIES: glycosyltransferase [unclassified Sphingomonas]|uniref:glycosyltransferase n=1 Tax=unclassified Sphingomonas TaxID=196159 RepID=UPI000BC57466|nr:MAG: glycosyltransferase [Sphingomonas sp. 32-62-10]